VPADAKKLYYRIELRFIPCGSATPVMTQLVKSLFTVNNLASGCTKLAGPSGNRAKGELPFH
jgi:hypothetical protein